MIAAEHLHELEQLEQHFEHVPVTLENPDAGDPLVYKVPGAVEQLPLSVSFTYTCSGAAGNRIPFVSFVDAGGVPFAEVATPFLLVATNVARVTFGVGVDQFGANSAARIGAGIPPLRLGDRLRLELSATGILAGDRITNARLFVRQYPLRPFDPERP